jgi:hypothetical protein
MRFFMGEVGESWQNGNQVQYHHPAAETIVRYCYFEKRWHKSRTTMRGLVDRFLGWVDEKYRFAKRA